MKGTFKGREKSQYKCIPKKSKKVDKKKILIKEKKGKAASRVIILRNGRGTPQ